MVMDKSEINRKENFNRDVRGQETELRLLFPYLFLVDVTVAPSQWRANQAQHLDVSSAHSQILTSGA